MTSKPQIGLLDTVGSGSSIRNSIIWSVQYVQYIRRAMSLFMEQKCHIFILPLFFFFHLVKFVQSQQTPGEISVALPNCHCLPEGPYSQAWKLNWIFVPFCLSLPPYCTHGVASYSIWFPGTKVRIGLTQTLVHLLWYHGGVVISYCTYTWACFFLL